MLKKDNKKDKKKETKNKKLTGKDLDLLAKIEEMAAEIYYLPNTAFNCNLIYQKTIVLLQFIENSKLLKNRDLLEINETTLFLIKSKLNRYLKLNHLSVNPKIQEIKEQMEALKWMQPDEYGFFYEEDKIIDLVVRDVNSIRNSAKDVLKKHKEKNRKPTFDADYYFKQMLQDREELDYQQELKEMQEIIDNL